MSPTPWASTRRTAVSAPGTRARTLRPPPSPPLPRRGAPPTRPSLATTTCACAFYERPRRMEADFFARPTSSKRPTLRRGRPPSPFRSFSSSQLITLLIRATRDSRILCIRLDLYPHLNGCSNRNMDLCSPLLCAGEIEKLDRFHTPQQDHCTIQSSSTCALQGFTTFRAFPTLSAVLSALAFTASGHANRCSVWSARSHSLST